MRYVLLVQLYHTSANQHVQTTWGSRAGADADDSDRWVDRKAMLLAARPQYEYIDEKLDEKLSLREAFQHGYLDEPKRGPSTHAK
jgi:hypothetical protein